MIIFYLLKVGIYLSINITCERAQILTYTRSSHRSLVCHTFCDTKHPFIMVILEDPAGIQTPNLLQSDDYDVVHHDVVLRSI